jgi:hypothetical protein
MLNIPAKYDRDTQLDLTDISCQVSPRFSAGISKTALVDESGMIRTQMGTHSIS